MKPRRAHLLSPCPRVQESLGVGAFLPNPVLGWSSIQGRELQAGVTRPSSWLCWELEPLLSPSCTLPMGEAVLPPPHPGAPPSREPLSQASLWYGNFLSFQVLEKVLFLSVGQVHQGAPCQATARDRSGGPASPDPLPGSSLSSERGVGALPGGDTGRLTRPSQRAPEGTQGGGKWD